MRPTTLKPPGSLVLFTVLTQAAVGLHLMRTWFKTAIFECGPPTEVDTIVRPILPVVLVILVIGVAAAVWHLGRFGAVRFTLSNLKSSWLSRELVLVFLFGAAVAFQYVVERLGIGRPAYQNILGGVVVVLGLILIMAISKVYMLRTVPAWNSFATPAAFLGTTFLLGAAFLMAILAHLVDTEYFDPVLRRLRGFAALMAVWQLLLTGFHLRRLGRQGGAARESAQVVRTTLRPILAYRLTSLIVGAWLLIFSTRGVEACTLAAVALLGSELLGRFLFYAMHRRVGL